MKHLTFKTEKNVIVSVLVLILFVISVSFVSFVIGTRTASIEMSKNFTLIPNVASRIETLKTLSANSSPVTLTVEDRLNILKSLHGK